MHLHKISLVATLACTLISLQLRASLPKSLEAKEKLVDQADTLSSLGLPLENRIEAIRAQGS